MTQREGFIMKHRTALKLASKLKKYINDLSDMNISTADEVVALYSAGLRQNPLQQVHEQRAAVHYLRI